MSQIDTKIGPKIKAFRRQLGIQANKLAEEMSKGVISVWVRGEAQTPLVMSER